MQMQMQRGPQNFQGQQGQGQDGPWGGRKPSMGFRRTYALQQLALMQQGQGLAGYLNDDGDDEGRRSRKPVVRKTVDLSANVMKYMQNRIYERDERDRKEMRPTVDYVTEFEPQFRYQDNPSYAFATKYVSSSVNKIRAPIHSCAWTPEAKRLITGSHNGELTLWSGLTFNFETILQAHEAPIRVIRWSKNDLWMVTADDTGIVKYWQTTMNNAKAFRAHKEAIRDLSFSPTDIKFATASDDKSIGIWDFDQCREDVNLQGHHWDVKSVHWHPFKAMLLSGSKDNLVKVWDPRNGKCISTGHGHKNTVSKVQWNQNGNWFLSCSRDQLIKLWDVRMMKEVQTFRGHKKEVTSLAWHPHFERVFASGSFDGSIRYWMTGPDGSTQAEICGAHDAAIWDLAWHPMGHIIASTSNDHSTRFWTRNRPGDDMTDKYNANQLPEEEKAEALASLVEAARMNPGRFGKLPSVLEGYIETAEAKDDFGSSDFIPGLGTAETDLARVKAEQEKQQAKEAERQRQMELVATMRKRGRGDDDDDREDAYKRQRERRRRDDSDDEREDEGGGGGGGGWTTFTPATPASSSASASSASGSTSTTQTLPGGPTITIPNPHPHPQPASIVVRPPLPLLAPAASIRMVAPATQLQYPTIRPLHPGVPQAQPLRYPMHQHQAQIPVQVSPYGVQVQGVNVQGVRVNVPLVRPVYPQHPQQQPPRTAQPPPRR